MYKKRGCWVTILGILLLSLCATTVVLAQESTAKITDPGIVKFALLAAAIATGLSALAGGIAVAYVGAAAVGAMSEKPEVAGRALIFVGLAEGIAIYGLIIAIMILGKV